VTSIAVLVVESAPGRLLRVESELGVALPALHITSGQANQQYADRRAKDRQSGKSKPSFSHLPDGFTIPDENAMASSSKISVKRVYEAPAASDGFRVLVDRLWPRGLKKQSARVDLWLRDLAPSNELRKWFHANVDQWREFRNRYMDELREPSSSSALQELEALLDRERTISLLFASKQTERNNATVLKEFLEGMKKPPRGTDEGVSARTQIRRRARR
jgi:uncharacterized protein YeaO (DUF488 family)